MSTTLSCPPPSAAPWPSASVRQQALQRTAYWALLGRLAVGIAQERNWAFLTIAPERGSSTPNRGAVQLYSKRGSRRTSRGNMSTHSQEECHGPHNGILPQSALPCQRPNRPRHYGY